MMVSIGRYDLVYWILNGKQKRSRVGKILKVENVLIFLDVPFQPMLLWDKFITTFGLSGTL